jgi:hypothetical protein
MKRTVVIEVEVESDKKWINLDLNLFLEDIAADCVNQPYLFDEITVWDPEAYFHYFVANHQGENA